jgi:hypothetical protein
MGVCLSACMDYRSLTQPTYVKADDDDYVYVVETQQGVSSIRKCDIAPDNKVKCKLSFKLD